MMRWIMVALLAGACSIDARPKPWFARAVLEAGVEPDVIIEQPAITAREGRPLGPKRIPAGVPAVPRAIPLPPPRPIPCCD